MRFMKKIEGYITMIKGVISTERKDKTPNAFMQFIEQRALN
jgi:hypothetical protein